MPVQWVRVHPGDYKSTDGRFAIWRIDWRGWNVCDRHTKDPVMPQYNRMEHADGLGHGKRIVERWLRNDARTIPTQNDRGTRP